MVAMFLVLPLLVLFLGCLYLAILASSYRLFVPAIATVLLLPFGLFCMFTLTPLIRSGRPGPAEGLLFGFLGSFIAAWASGFLAASRAAAGRPYPGYPACQNCGYNLTGNVSGVCPECGQGTGTS